MSTVTQQRTVLRLRLRGAGHRRRRVTFAPGTVDNEFMNKKKSKACCIFHRSAANGDSADLPCVHAAEK